MIKDIQGAIFDLDGTIIDSMHVWHKIDVDFLAKRGMTCPDNIGAMLEGLSFHDTARFFKEKFNLTESVDEILEEWNSMAFDEYKNNIGLKPGMRTFLNVLKQSNIKIAIATSNYHPLIETVLEANGILDYFDSITTTSEVTRGKSFPDVYLLAAERIGVQPEHCVVFEDILPAVKGAKAAGMRVVGIFDESSVDFKDEIISTADHYIHSYDDIAI